MSTRLDEIAFKHEDKQGPSTALNRTFLTPEDEAYLIRIARAAEAIEKCAPECDMRSVKVRDGKTNTCNGCGNLTRLSAAIKGEK